MTQPSRLSTTTMALGILALFFAITLTAMTVSAPSVNASLGLIAAEAG